MEQNLINKLWEHSDKIEEENAKRALLSVPKKEAEKPSSDSPLLFSASFFFRDASQSLFMSFHRESGNSIKHYHDFFELIYVCKGSPIGVINGQEIHLQEGNLCIMNPNAVHYFKKYTKETDLILNIVLPTNLFQKSLFQVLFHDPLLNAFFIRYRVENVKQPSFLYLQSLDKDTDHLIELLAKEYLDKKQYSQVIIESLLTLIFSFIIRCGTEHSRHGNTAMAEIIDYIYMNYQTVSMNAVASQFNYHPKYLSALIHKQTGQTFRDLIVHIRLQNAINYLLYTDYSIEHIVAIIGYKDKSSFYSLFKKEYGMSPAEYRKQHGAFRG